MDFSKLIPGMERPELTTAKSEAVASQYSEQNCMFDRKVLYDRINIMMRHVRYNQEEIEVGKGLRYQLGLRSKYLDDPKEATKKEKAKWKKVEWVMRNGVFRVRRAGRPEDDRSAELHDVCLQRRTVLMKWQVIEYDEFEEDLEQLWRFAKSGPGKTHCFKRLTLLQKKFEMHSVLNRGLENDFTKNDPKDFYNIWKVDNHIHLAAAMTASHLLLFMKKKMKVAAKDVVFKTGKKNVKLKDVFAELELTEDNISIDRLDVMAGQKMFHRFDYFNNAYNPFGDSKMRSIFLKVTNHMNGRYFAELSKEVFQWTQQQQNNVLMEPRVSVYGRSTKDWTEVANWAVSNRIFADNVLFIVQIPRIFKVFRRANHVKNFAQYLDNIFRPLFEVTANPSKNPVLHEFLKHVVAFDSVDDESPYDGITIRNFRSPEEWSGTDQPPYSYYLYYMAANLKVLNTFRRMRGLNTFKLRPHCGEAGEVHHLATCFILADGINHGIQLKNTPVLQYLYFLAQIGLSVSPLSNNVLFCPLERNPFAQFLKVGMNVALSTDDPLQFHTTQEPLIEEYTIAKQFWKLSVVDLSEVARNSVMQSGFSHERKCAMLGPKYQLSGVVANDVTRSNIPDCRVSFRWNCMLEEFRFVRNASRGDYMDSPIGNFRSGWRWLCLSSKRITLWRALMDYNTPNLDGSLPFKNHLTFDKGAVIVVLTTVADEEEPEAEQKEPPKNSLWYGRDEYGNQGYFPPNCGQVITRGMGKKRYSLVRFRSLSDFRDEDAVRMDHSTPRATSLPQTIEE